MDCRERQGLREASLKGQIRIAGSDAGTTEWLKDLATWLLPNAQGRADLFRERVTAWLPFIFLSLPFFFSFVTGLSGQIDANLIELLEFVQIRPGPGFNGCLPAIGTVTQHFHPRIRQ